MKKLLLILIPVLLIAGCGQNKNSNNHNDISGSSASNSTSVVQTAKQAYIYSLPLVIMDITRRQMTDPSNSMFAPVNQFRHNASFPDANFRNVVRPNADTYYSTAFLDLSAEPVVLSLPNTNGRYYMMPMLDAYSNVFASPGTRTTGNGAGDFLISGPQWNGTVPAGMKQVKAPTNTVWIIGRTQVNSKEDGDKIVVPLQKQYRLTPLSAFGKNYIAPKPSTDTTVPKGDPNTIVKNMPVEKYFNYVNALLTKNPPPGADDSVMKNFAAIGVGPDKKFYLDSFKSADRSAIENISKDVFAQLDKDMTAKPKLVNGWNVGRDVIGSYGTDYYNRASVAYMGLGANLREDAIYPSCNFDADGNALNGANKYVLHFDKGKTPPAKGFWSLTMYDPEGYFVPNTINRYAIGDRSNLQTNTDGSIDIYIQHDNPGKDKEKNWLPAPAGDFNILMRVYWPKEEMLNKTWEIPPVKKTN